MFHYSFSCLSDQTMYLTWYKVHLNIIYVNNTEKNNSDLETVWKGAVTKKCLLIWGLSSTLEVQWRWIYVLEVLVLKQQHFLSYVLRRCQVRSSLFWYWRFHLNNRAYDLLNNHLKYALSSHWKFKVLWDKTEKKYKQSSFFTAVKSLINAEFAN